MRRDGFAVLVALWALALLGTLALSFSYAMRTEALAARNGLDAARAYFQARTGVNRALAAVQASGADNAAGVPLTGGADGASYEAVVESESGKIDVNLVAEPLLKSVLEKGGLPPEEAEAVGDAILDWRDPDDSPRPAGAERADYASLPEPVVPRNGALRRLEELLSVRGVRPEFYRRFLSKVLTVDGHTALVNVNRAPAAVLEAMPGFTPELASEAVERRKETPFRNAGEVSAFLAGRAAGPPGAVSPFSATSAGGAWSVTSTGRAGEGAVRRIRCLFDFGGPLGERIRILKWEDLVAEEERPS